MLWLVIIFIINTTMVANMSSVSKSNDKMEINWFYAMKSYVLEWRLKVQPLLLCCFEQNTNSSTTGQETLLENKKWSKDIYATSLKILILKKKYIKSVKCIHNYSTYLIYLTIYLSIFICMWIYIKSYSLATISQQGEKFTTVLP